MASVSFSELEAIYRALKQKCNDIIEDDIWNKNDAIKIYSYLNTLKSAVKKYPNWIYYDAISNDMPTFEYVYNRLVFNDDLYAASDWVQYTLYNYANKNAKVVVIENITIEDAVKFINALLSKKLLNLHKSDIAKIITAKITSRALYNLYKSVKFKTDDFNRINESFYNPFDDDLLMDDEIKTDNPSKNIINTQEINNIKIKKVRPYNKNNHLGSLIYKNGRIYANRSFFKGDIIEVCPVRILHDDDLYSSGVRKIVFPIDLSSRIFGVPYGLVCASRCENETNLNGNVDYIYDPNIENEINVYAVKNIKKGDEIIFISDNKMQYNKDLSSKQIHLDDILNISPIMK